MKQTRTQKIDEKIVMMVGCFVAVLTNQDEETQRFWIAQVLEIQPRQRNGERKLSVEWYNAKNEFGVYKRWSSDDDGGEQELEMSQCLFWFPELAKGKIPKAYRNSIESALEHGVDRGAVNDDEDDEDPNDGNGDDGAEAALAAAADDDNEVNDDEINEMMDAIMNADDDEED